MCVIIIDSCQYQLFFCISDLGFPRVPDHARGQGLWNWHHMEKGSKAVISDGAASASS